MSTYSFMLRATSGEPLAFIPSDAFLYFELEMELHSIGRFEGVLSMRRFKPLPSMFSLSKEGDPLDAVLEVWHKPFTGRNKPYIRPYLLTQFLFRYERGEYLPGGRPRKTIILRNPLHLLTRPIVYPPGDLPMIVTDEASLQLVRDAYTLGVPPPPVVTDPYYLGAPPVVDTSAQMVALMNYCAINSPSAFAPISITPQPPGGIADHRTAYRYDSTVLNGLKRLSAASWYAWSEGLCPLPVDFSLEPSAAPPWFPWEFKVWPGGRGQDRRVGNPYGNPALVFSAERDNVTQASAIVDRLEEIVSITVGGQGEKELRDVLRVQDPSRMDDSPWNANSERFLHSSKAPEFADPGGVDTAYQSGLARLREKSIRVQVALKTRTKAGSIFGRDFFLGDLCTQSVLGTTRDMQIAKYSVKATSDSPFDTQVELKTLDGSDFDGGNQYKMILNRINGVREDVEYYGEDY